MTGILIGVVIAALVVLAFAFEQRKVARISAQNEELRDQLLEKTGEAKIEKASDKLSEDQASGAQSAADYYNFRAAHPELFPPKDGKK